MYRTAPRYTGDASRPKIWRPLKPILLKRFRPRTGLAKRLRARTQIAYNFGRNSSTCGNLSSLSPYFPNIPAISQRHSQVGAPGSCPTYVQWIGILYRKQGSSTNVLSRHFIPKAGVLLSTKPVALPRSCRHSVEFFNVYVSHVSHIDPLDLQRAGSACKLFTFEDSVLLGYGGALST